MSSKNKIFQINEEEGTLYDGDWLSFSDHGDYFNSFGDQESRYMMDKLIVFNAKFIIVDMLITDNSLAYTQQMWMCIDKKTLIAINRPIHGHK